MVVLTLNHSLDIYFSKIFYKEGRVLYNAQLTKQLTDGISNGFLNQNYYFFTIIIRKFVLPFIYIYILFFSLISFIVGWPKLFFGFRFGLRDLFFVWSSAALTILMVGGLKNNWGRARPKDVLEFGGQQEYTKWFEVADNCFKNCSFVSGDVSVAVFVVSLYLITKNKLFLYACFFLSFLVGLMRLSVGAHFISDVLMSFLLITTFLFLWKKFCYEDFK
tara:strand:- start:46 stop:702 length:657 start_codon:yes stop_codon:yes gene_type:complete